MKTLLDHFAYKWMVHRFESNMLNKQAVIDVDSMIPNIDTLRVSAEDIEKDKNNILKEIDDLAEIAVDVSSS